jgi:PKD repeat protein
MKRLLLVALLILASACGSSSHQTPVTPTLTPTPAPPPTPVPVPLFVTVVTSPPMPQAGQTVTFLLTWRDTSGDVQRVIMDPGDGTAPLSFTSTPSSVSHIYTSAGTFLATVTATDAAGKTVSADTALVVSKS